MSPPPILIALMSVFKTKLQSQFGRQRTGAVTRAYINYSNAFYYACLQVQVVCLVSNIVKGASMCTNCRIKQLLQFTRPKNNWSYLTVVGISHSNIALTLEGSAVTFLTKMLCPRYSTDAKLNADILSEIFKLYAYSYCKAYRTYSEYFFCFY